MVQLFSAGWIIAAVAAVAAIICVPAPHSAIAQHAPDIIVLPAKIAAARPDLVERRAAVVAELNATDAEINAFNDECSSVPTGSAAEASCRSREAKIDAMVASFEQHQDQYNSLARAVIADSQTPVEPPTVDARHVPSGLPVFVEDSFPHSPAGDRERKAYQAIQAHDWNAAHAWFEDALKYAPGNDGIQRMIDMAQFMMDHKKTGTPLETRQADTGAVIERVGTTIAPDAKATLGDQWHAFVTDYLPKHPELMAPRRAAASGAAPSDAEVAAYVKYLQQRANLMEDHGTMNVVGSGFFPTGSVDEQAALDAGYLQTRLAYADRDLAKHVAACHCDVVKNPGSASPDRNFLFPAWPGEETWPQPQHQPSATPSSLPPAAAQKANWDVFFNSVFDTAKNPYDPRNVAAVRD